MKTIPIKVQTVNMRDGQMTEVKTTNAMVMPPRPGAGQVCATPHEPQLPHNADSIYYQITFNAEHGRAPTWADAMAHCTDDVRAQCTNVLLQHGIVVETTTGGAA